MKLNFLVACAFLLVSMSAVAQRRYLSFSGGYTLPVPGNMKGGLPSSQLQVESFSLGKGLNAELVLGSYWNQHFGMELAYSYLAGEKAEAERTSTFLPDKTDRTDYQARMHRITPALLYKWGNGKIKPYAKLGFVIANATLTYHYVLNHKDIQTQEATVTERTWTYNKGTSYGALLALGAVLPLGEKFDLLGELRITALSFAPKKGKLIRSTENGVDNLAQLSPYATEREFGSGSGSGAYSPGPNTAQAMHAPKTFYPFSSIGLNIGLRYRF